MIIYGSNSRHLKTVQLQQEKCPNCGTSGSMVVSIYNRYAHVFWIPLFPIGRTGGSQCQQCKQVLEPKAMPQFLRMQYDTVMTQTKIPVYSFAGLAIIVALFAWGAYQGSVDTGNEKQFLASPLMGDVYHFKTESGFSLMKVADVTPDSIFVLFNLYESDKRTGSRELKTKDYDSLGVWIPRKTILAMYDSSEIYDVER